MLLTLSRREIRWVLPSSMNISASFTAHAPGSVAKNQARQLLGDWIGRPSGSYIIQAQNINPSTQLEVVITHGSRYAQGNWLRWNRSDITQVKLQNWREKLEYEYGTRAYPLMLPEAGSIKECARIDWAL
ncbi:hypothetical protein PSTG_09499 [Puccinia striiformis f. sp. tritici PST-78]|uniref:Uncharacterized protein n=1 Tax=Puccinia striiformis f. sp. tritici PST-78 TaxID=1165861 RepID=A0A0L0VDG3_9BASI|nr:hypothetical protein PSTG_09499 [Puccinia striiformis f. sp. tritici PST-78]